MFRICAGVVVPEGRLYRNSELVMVCFGGPLLQNDWVEQTYLWPIPIQVNKLKVWGGEGASKAYLTQTVGMDEYLWLVHGILHGFYP